MYGIGHREMKVAQWKAMFLICGGLTVFAGILFFFLMPTGPDTAWFLKPHEKEIAAKRLQVESEGGDQTYFSMSQLKEAACDIRAYLSFFFGVLITLPSPVIAVSIVWPLEVILINCSPFLEQFASLIIHYLGYSNFDTMLYTSPSGAVQIGFVWVGILFCYLWPNRRCAILIGLTIVPLTGVILLFALPLTAGWGMIVASWLV